LSSPAKKQLVNNHESIVPKLSTFAFGDVVDLIPSRARTMGSKSAIDTTDTSEPRLKLDEAALLGYMRRVRPPPHTRRLDRTTRQSKEDKNDDRRHRVASSATSRLGDTLPSTVSDPFPARTLIVTTSTSAHRPKRRRAPGSRAEPPRCGSRSSATGSPTRRTKSIASAGSPPPGLLLWRRTCSARNRRARF